MNNHFQFKVTSTLYLLFLPTLCTFHISQAQNTEKTPHKTTEPLFVEVTETHLPVADLQGFSMDAKTADVDSDGDLDIITANFDPGDFSGTRHNAP